MDDKSELKDKKISRRDFVKDSALLFGTLFTCSLITGCSSEAQRVEITTISNEEAQKLTQEYLSKIADIQKDPQKYGINPTHFQKFQQKVIETYPGISLRYSDDPFIAYLRKRPLNEAVILAIAGLNLMTSSRYNRGDTYTCNIYALDLLRAILGNEAIGDRYQKDTGAPFSFGLADLDWADDNLIQSINNQYPYLHGNNFDWWARNFGKNYGWQLINPSEILFLKQCVNFIGVYCSSQEEIERQRRTDPNFYGHMGVIFVPIPDKPFILARSQATNHYPFEVLPTNPPHHLVKGILAGKFNVYTHIYKPFY